ncbi:Nitrogen regulatory protein [Candidatus Westeberhardia cardiocondylae]|uniref:Nitrogen regulatory protein n=1 Tax=Candidatus Westeberhardia cardiocondylae TaxID=1594731 RepID=A0A0H5BWI2_9ENTR|nr:PTS sugar transporter subunit IIA [Candidatus Westeberhardia cardiocondylae]MCR3756360.1 phosphotransferase system enzyme IIA(Ntr) [Candidatus Westeberhardia cardiocondylae]CEN31983.1 Nitrogen regulatory protein [Candidatus Westeberhardia cardiocondylae]
MKKNKFTKIDSILSIECTRGNVYCQNKKKALEIISEIAAKKLKITPKIIYNAVVTREKMGSTGIGNGIAIPHGTIQINIPQETIGVFIRLIQPIFFDSIDNQPVDLLFSILISKKTLNRNLYKLSLIAQHLSNKKLYRLLRCTHNNERLYKIITEK